jgi:hypothetical protein
MRWRGREASSSATVKKDGPLALSFSTPQGTVSFRPRILESFSLD